MNEAHGADAGAGRPCWRRSCASARKNWLELDHAYLSTRGDPRPQARSARSCSKAWRPTAASTCRRTIRRSTPPRSRSGAALPYADLAFEILSLYIDDIPAADLTRHLPQDLHRARCSARREIVPLTPLEPGVCAARPCPTARRWPSRTWRCSCWATCSSTSWRRRGEDAQHPRRDLRRHRQRGRIRDARQAAACGSSCLSPHGRMSPFQQAQMFSLQDANIHNLAIEGVFDDCQDIVKAVSNDLDFKRTLPHRHGQLDQLGAAAGAGGLLLRRLFPGHAGPTTEQVELRRALGQLRQHLRRPRRPHDGPADPRTWCSRPTRTTCSTSSSAPAPTACAAARDATRPRARRWTSRRRRNFERFVFDLLGRDGARARHLFDDAS